MSEYLETHKCQSTLRHTSVSGPRDTQVSEYLETHKCQSTSRHTSVRVPRDTQVSEYLETRKCQRTSRHASVSGPRDTQVSEYLETRKCQRTSRHYFKKTKPQCTVPAKGLAPWTTVCRWTGCRNQSRQILHARNTTVSSLVPIPGPNTIVVRAGSAGHWRPVRAEWNFA